jgi:hypothetical protein
MCPHKVFFIINKPDSVLNSCNSVISFVFKDAGRGAEGNQSPLPRRHIQDTQKSDQLHGSRNESGEVEFEKLTIQISESGHFNNIISVEISISYRNRGKQISSTRSDETKPKMKRENENRNTKGAEAFSSPNLSVEISVEEGPWKREHKFEDVTNRSPSGTESQKFPEGNGKPQVFPSTSSFNYEIKSHVNTTHPSSIPTNSSFNYEIKSHDNTTHPSSIPSNSSFNYEIKSHDNTTHPSSFPSTFPSNYEIKYHDNTTHQISAPLQKKESEEGEL